MRRILLAPIIATILLMGCCLEGFGQNIFIDKITVEGKYGASYLTSYSSVYLYNIKYINLNQIRSVVREFEASRLYERVDWNLQQGTDTSSKELVLRPIYPRDYEAYVLDQIILDRLPGVDEKAFGEALELEGVSLGSPWYTNSFIELNSKISSALAKSVSDESAQKEIGSLWITVRCLRARRVTLIVHGSSFDHMAIFGK